MARGPPSLRQKTGTLLPGRGGHNFSGTALNMTPSAEWHLEPPLGSGRPNRLIDVAAVQRFRHARLMNSVSRRIFSTMNSRRPVQQTRRQARALDSLYARAD